MRASPTTIRGAVVCALAAASLLLAAAQPAAAQVQGPYDKTVRGGKLTANQVKAPVSYTHLTLPTTPYV